ncbi:MAG: tetratricopeptide repeat protein, partial [candidate division KSB1 bacterium]|nr:tetratricopeptide repeat protein [candidate division KSB1 bacterium]
TARGDYETALKYLSESLSILREIGDKGGMIPTLHNMAHIFLQQNDLQQAVEHFAEAYRLALETKDAMGLFNVGRDLGQLLVASGEKEKGVQILRQAYEIGRNAGLAGTEEIKNILNAIGERGSSLAQYKKL